MKSVLPGVVVRFSHLQILAIDTLHDPDLLVSCGVDGSLRVWELHDRTLVQVYAIEFSKPYQGMNLTDVQGLNSSQLATLKQLGAQATY